MAHGGCSSRQKSCNACVKSKRRCDKRIPACGNCTKKQHLCVYGGQLDVQSCGNSADISISLDSVTSPLSTSCGDNFVLNDIGFSASFDTGMGLPPTATLRIDNTIESLLNSIPGSGYGDTPALCDLLRQDTEVESSPMSKALSRQDYSKMLAMCDDFAPWQLADSSTRIAYAMSVFKNLHTSFAQNNSTICMHRRLYVDDTPRWILQAFSLCVLYKNQTDATRGFVLKVLHENVRDLIEMAGGTAFTPREKLARVHALMVYQTIRMFDGDISLGQQADNDVPLLEAWNNELKKVRDNLEEFAELNVAEIRNKPPESWERWFFAESVRRTYIIASALKTFWEVLKGRRVSSDIGNWRHVHRWSLSRHLWDAMSPLDFLRAWREKPMWIISAFCFDEFLRNGTGDDVDDFALVFLTLSFGVNEMKMFYYETSGRLLP
ncbi:hypothetical protein F4677DRAFT_459869 [Hypoxylon crocopeplum]|nr:hypothetical protein F4677DRAFT_459869 [Hypoxylon crocopeplum]